MAIKVTTSQGEKTYETAVRFETDGFGDVVLYDANDNKVALVPRSKRPEVEVV